MLKLSLYIIGHVICIHLAKNIVMLCFDFWLSLSFLPQVEQNWATLQGGEMTIQTTQASEATQAVASLAEAAVAASQEMQQGATVTMALNRWRQGGGNEIADLPSESCHIPPQSQPSAVQLIDTGGWVVSFSPGHGAPQGFMHTRQTF